MTNDELPKMPALILFGPAGSGKDSAGLPLTQAFPELFYVGSGDIVRAILNDVLHPKRPLVNRYLTQGKLVPDDEMMDLFWDYLGEQRLALQYTADKTLLLNGLPRTFAQARELGLAIDVKAVYHFTNLPNYVLQQRLENRVREMIASGKTPRTDDTPDAIAQRIKDYYVAIYPTLDYYAEQNIPINCIDASLSKEGVKKMLFDYVQRLLIPNDEDSCSL